MPLSVHMLEWFLFPQPKVGPKNRAEKPPARTKSSATIQTNSLLDMGISRKVKERKPHLDSSSRNRNRKWIIWWRSNWPWLFYSIRWSQNSQPIFLGIKISVYKFSGNVPCFSFRWKLRAQPEIPPPSMGNTSRHAGKIQPVMCTSPTIAYASANIFQKSCHFPISYKYRLSMTKNFPDVTTSFNGHVNEYDIEKRLCVTKFWPLKLRYVHVDLRDP